MGKRVKSKARYRKTPASQREAGYQGERAAGFQKRWEVGDRGIKLRRRQIVSIDHLAHAIHEWRTHQASVAKRLEQLTRRIKKILPLGLTVTTERYQVRKFQVDGHRMPAHQVESYISLAITPAKEER